MSVRVDWRGPAIQKRLEAAQMTAINQTLENCESKTKGLLNRSSGGGRMYPKGVRGNIMYQASAPGEPPVKVTGILQGSIGSRHAVRQGRRIVGQWGSYNVKYSLELEIGSTRIAKRPYLRPIAAEEYPKLAGRIQKLFAGSGT